MKEAKWLVCILLLSAGPASADPLLDLQSRDTLASWMGAGSLSFNLTAEKQGLVTNDFWLALEDKGPTLLVYEAIVGGTTYLVGGFSPISMSRNHVDITEDGRELSAGRHYSFDDAERDALIFNLSTGTVFRERSSADMSLVWFMDSGFGIQFGEGDLSVTGSQLSQGSARASNFGTGDTNLFGFFGTTSFTVGRLEAYSIATDRVPEPTTLLMIGAAVPIYAAFRRRRRS
jgi:hypothetical protein